MVKGTRWRLVVLVGCTCLMTPAHGPVNALPADVVWAPRVDVSANETDDIELTGSADGSRLVGAWSGAAGVETAFSVDAGTTWSRPRTVAPAGGRWVRVAASDDGRHVIITWQRRIPSDQVRADMPRVQYSISADGGRTWTRARTVRIGGRRDTPANPVISSDGQHLALAFARKVSRYAAMVITSDDGGVRWTRPQRLSAGADLRVYPPAIAASSEGTRMIVAWGSLDGAIHVRTTADHAATWTPDVVALRSDTPTPWGPEAGMSADGSRALVATIADDATRPPEVEVAAVDTSGGGWTAHRVPSEGALDARMVMSATGDDLVVVWATADALKSAYSGDAGATWSTPHPLWGQGVFYPGITSVALVGSADADTATVAWLSADGVEPKRMTTTVTVDGGASWATPAPVLGTPAYDYGLFTSADGSRLTALVPGDGGLGKGVGSISGTVVGAPTGQQPPPGVEPWSPEPIATATATRAAGALKVRVKPRFRKSQQWRFHIRKRTGNGWRTLRTRTGAKRVFKTKGSKHVRVVNLQKGVYKVRVLPARGYLSDTSARVKLRY